MNYAKLAEQAFLGLAPFLRMNLAGVDLLPIAQAMTTAAERQPDNANLWMNLATAMFCVGQREIALQIQAQALEMQRIFYLAASRRPAKLRLLMIMAADDLAGNTPLDCLLENSDIDLIYYFLPPGAPLALADAPDHDVLMTAISETDRNLDLLTALTPILSGWPRPVINSPDKIPAIERGAAARLLQDIPGLLIPPTIRVGRNQLSKINQLDSFAALGDAGRFQMIARPVDAHGGHGLQKIASEQDVAAYLDQVADDEFFISPFIDYSGADGLFRKIRIALVDGAPYVCHMAVSQNWMIHYLNADMYQNPERRAEEAAFMADFEVFAERHRLALREIYRRTGLEYLCLDCAETADGRLLVFEIDHAMVVHAMDPVELFPFKQAPMLKLQNAFREFLFRLGPRPAG